MVRCGEQNSSGNNTSVVIRDLLTGNQQIVLAEDCQEATIITSTENILTSMRLTPNSS